MLLRHVCDVWISYTCIYAHNKCLPVISVSFKPIYNQSECKALSFLICTGCFKEYGIFLNTEMRAE